MTFDNCYRSDRVALLLSLACSTRNKRNESKQLLLLAALRVEDTSNRFEVLKLLVAPLI